ncbi:MAG: hypothetical protein ACXAAM_09185, partial [Candidatus Heimdallarchaeaceae archaeon]
MVKSGVVIKTIFLFSLFLSSIVYFNPNLVNEVDTDNTQINTNIVDSSETSGRTTNQETDSSFRVKTIETPGDYQLRGFFSEHSFVDVDSDGDIIEWMKYDSIKDVGWDSSDTIAPRIDSNYQSFPDLWPDQSDTYYYPKDRDWPYQVSAMFSPEFKEETYIDGKVYFLTYISTSFPGVSPPLTITFRIRLLLFNITDTSTSEILSIEDVLPNIMSRQQKVYSSTLSSPFIIPADSRLKVVYEAKLSTLDRTGNLFVYGGRSSFTNLNWNINDGEYSNSYTVADSDYLMGVQFKMYDQTYPDILVSGFTNNTVYQENKTISIDVSGSESSSYRWDGGSFVNFGASTTTDLPFTPGWHTLEIQTLDEFNNNRTEIYEIGYDASVSNIVLNSPANNSLIGKGHTLYFTPFSINYATYEWDTSGAQNLTALNYELIAPDFSGLNYLTIITYDDFGTESYFYVFEFDNNPPNVNLHNVINDTSQPAGKRIDVNVTDTSGVDQVFYKWDTRDNFTWYPFQGSIYRTYL